MEEKKKPRKMTAKDWARWQENDRRLEELIQRRLERDGTTREEIERRLGLS